MYYILLYIQYSLKVKANSMKNLWSFLWYNSTHFAICCVLIYRHSLVTLWHNIVKNPWNVVYFGYKNSSSSKKMLLTLLSNVSVKPLVEAEVEQEGNINSRPWGVSRTGAPGTKRVPRKWGKWVCQGTQTLFWIWNSKNTLWRLLVAGWI